MTTVDVVVHGILNLVEDMLEEKGITIPDEDREGNDDEARLYGMTYWNLHEDIVDLLKQSNIIQPIYFEDNNLEDNK